MAKPIIMTIDDDPQVLAAVERDLRRRYASEHQILAADSGLSALETTQALKQRGDEVALFLVDQRMPQMTGIEFLTAALPLYPDARKVLLTAYADTQVAIEGINSIGLDYYLLKPWTPAEQNLYPVVDEVLSDWFALASLPFEGIRVVGHLASASSHRVKDFLARNLIPYQWLDLDTDPRANALVASIENPDNRLPILFFPDGQLLIDPEPRELADRVGLTTSASQLFYDLIVLGAGPAGLGAAVYAASEGLRVALVEKEAPGGQAGQSARIENYLGFPKGLSGSELARRAVTQARRFGVEILTARQVEAIETEVPFHIVHLAGGDRLSCHALLVSTGVETRQLGVPGAKELTGAGLYYGTTLSEARHYVGQRVFVVGGGNSAAQGVEFLARFASRVTLLARGASLADSMSRYLVDRIEHNHQVEVMNRVEVVAVEGDTRLQRVQIKQLDDESLDWLDGPAMFVYIGAAPRTTFLNDGLACDAAGFLLTGPDLLTGGERPAGWWPKRDPFLLECSVAGIFAAGDVRHGSVKRVAAAIGEGGAAVQSIHQYLRTV
jgi:thioredoxin reductase (NADPH)